MDGWFTVYAGRWDMDEAIVNSQIDTYFIKQRLKAGGVAVVYEAIDADGKPVAFKLLQSSWAEHEEVIYRFQREARIMQQLRHPHIVEFLNYGMYRGRPYIVMEFMEGGSLAERLKKVAYIRLGGSARLIQQIASALDYAHKKNVIHRDIKPGNILLKNAEYAALTDFGIARVLEQTMLTVTGNMPGTPHYMSPEQARGQTDLGPSSDLYALAVIAFLLITGGLPFKGTDPIVIINQHLSSPPPKPSEVNPELPQALDAVMQKALAKNPEDRFLSAGEFSQAFDEAIRGHGKVNVVLSSRKTGINPAVQSVVDPESIVFSSDAVPVEREPTSAALDWEPHEFRRPRKTRLPAFIGVVIFMGIAVLVMLSRGGNGSDSSETRIPLAAAAGTETPTSTPDFSATAGAIIGLTQTREADVTSAALEATNIALSNTPTPTLTHTLTPTFTPTSSDTPTLTPTDTPSNTPTATHTPTLTPTPSHTPTPTPNLTGTAEAILAITQTREADVTSAALEATNIALSYTPTLTPTFTATPTATATYTRTPTMQPIVGITPSATPTITPTPYTPTFAELVDDLFNGVGTASRFDCPTFVAAYQYLDERLAENDSDFARGRGLIGDPDAPIQIIYDDYCQNDPENTRAFIDAALFADMRRILNELR